MSSKSTGEGNKAITVILPMSLYEALKGWAEEKDWKVSQAASNLIEQGLGDEHNSHPKKSRGKGK